MSAALRYRVSRPRCPVFIGIAQRVDVRGELRQPFGDLLDDGAELGVPVGVSLAQLGGTEVDLGKQALEGALKGLRLDIFKARLQGVQQGRVLGAGQVGDAMTSDRLCCSTVSNLGIGISSPS